MEDLFININIRNSFLRQLAFQDKILSFYSPSYSIITGSKYLKDYLGGKNIIVKDRNEFEKYRNKVLIFFNLVEEKGNTFKSLIIKKSSTNQIEPKITKNKIQKQKVKTTNKLSKHLTPNNFKISLRD